MIPELIHIADAFNPRIGALMRRALEDRKPQGIAVAMKQFGKDLPSVCKRCEPTVEAIDQMVSGFKVWLDTSGYGDDRRMIAALLAITDRLDGMPTPYRPPVPLWYGFENRQ